MDDDETELQWAALFNKQCAQIDELCALVAKQQVIIDELNAQLKDGSRKPRKISRSLKATSVTFDCCEDCEGIIIGFEDEARELLASGHLDKDSAVSFAEAILIRDRTIQ
jgi:hypothetical protein